MKILLTGATGVFGSYLLKNLIDCGHKVICLKRFSSLMKNVIDLVQYATWYDLNGSNLVDIFREENIDVVIHSATNYGKDPTEYFDTYEANLTLPISLLRLACKYKVRAFISTGTFFDKEIEDKALSSQHIYMDTYVKSKHIFEYLATCGIGYTETLFINMRLEHVYALDSRRKFVNYILENLRDNVDSLELSEGTQCRDWIYIDDVAKAYLCVLDNLRLLDKSKSYVFEVGTGEAHTVREFVELCKKITGAGTKLQFGKHPMDSTEIFFSKADISELARLGWKPDYTIERGIKEILSKMR